MTIQPVVRSARGDVDDFEGPSENDDNSPSARDRVIALPVRNRRAIVDALANFFLATLDSPTDWS